MKFAESENYDVLLSDDEFLKLMDIETSIKNSWESDIAMRESQLAQQQPKITKKKSWLLLHILHH